jgi:hypothetical protein
MNPSWRKNYSRYRALFLNAMNNYRKRGDIKAYLEILLSLATISIFAVFALRPTLLTISKLLKEIDGKEKTLQVMNEKIENLSGARNLYEQEKSKIELLDTAIPRGPNPEVFARQIALILGDQSSATTNEGGTKGSFPKNAGSVTFSTGAKAVVDQFQLVSDFLSDFEMLRRPTKIDSLSLTVKKEGTETTVSLIIGGKLPYFSDSNSNKETTQ